MATSMARRLEFGLIRRKPCTIIAPTVTASSALSGTAAPPRASVRRHASIGTRRGCGHNAPRTRGGSIACGRQASPWSPAPARDRLLSGVAFNKRKMRAEKLPMKTSSHLEKVRKLETLRRKLDPADDFELWFWAGMTAGTHAVNAALHHANVTRDDDVFPAQPGVYLVQQADGSLKPAFHPLGDVLHVG